MTADPGAHVQARLLALRDFLTACPPGLEGARLVRYSGVGSLACDDIALAQLESRVSGCVTDGLCIDWIYRNKVLYLRVFAFDGPKPSWERIFAQQDLDEVRAMLTGGLDGDA